MLTSSTIAPSGTKAARIAISSAQSDGQLRGGPEARVHLGHPLREQAVAGHREEDARLPVEDDQHHAGDRDQRAEREDPRRPGQTGAPSRAVASGASLSWICGGGDAEGADRGEDVEQRADQQRPDDRERQVLAGLRASSLPVDTASNPM